MHVFFQTDVEIQMKLLNLENCQHVSGGDVTVSLTTSVPTNSMPEFVTVLGMLLTNQLDANGLASIISSNPGSFNNTPIQKITVGNFAITPIATATGTATTTNP